MSFAYAAYMRPGGENKLAKWEMHTRFGIRQGLWWKYVPGVIVSVPWPSGWVELHKAADGSAVAAESSDPNDHFRPWLEENVGRQGIDWEWREAIGDSMHTPGYEQDMIKKDQVLIKFRNKHKEQAVLFKLKYS